MHAPEVCLLLRPKRLDVCCGASARGGIGWAQKFLDSIADAMDRVFAGRGQQPGAGLGQRGDHLPPFLRLVQQRAKRGGERGGGEAAVE